MISATSQALELLRADAPKIEHLLWEEDENGVVHLSHQDGTPWGFMPRADFDRLRKHVEEKTT